MNPEWIAALTLGLLGSGHCLGMCGGLAGAFGMSSQGHRNYWLITLYQLGRISSYMLIGALFGLLGQSLLDIQVLAPWLRSLAGILLMLMGIAIAGWWMGIHVVEKAGQILWRRLQPISRSLLPVRTPTQAISIGLLWGWLPCGLVYSSLAWSATTANSTLESALLMACFGLGTLPAMLTISLAGLPLKQLLQQTWLRQIAGGLLIAMGLWTTSMPLYHALAGQHHHPTIGDTEQSQTPTDLPDMPASHHHHH